MVLEAQPDVQVKVPRRRSRFPWRALWRDKTSAAAFLFIVFIIIASVIGPMISPYEVSGRNWPTPFFPVQFPGRKLLCLRHRRHRQGFVDPCPRGRPNFA